MSQQPPLSSRALLATATALAVLTPPLAAPGAPGTMALGGTCAAGGAFDAAARVFRAGLAVPERFPVDAGFKRLMSECLTALGRQPGAALR